MRMKPPDWNSATLVLHSPHEDVAARLELGHVGTLPGGDDLPVQREAPPFHGRRAKHQRPLPVGRPCARGKHGRPRAHSNCTNIHCPCHLSKQWESVQFNTKW